MPCATSSREQPGPDARRRSSRSRRAVGGQAPRRRGDRAPSRRPRFRRRRRTRRPVSCGRPRRRGHAASRSRAGQLAADQLALGAPLLARAAHLAAHLEADAGCGSPGASAAPHAVGQGGGLHHASRAARGRRRGPARRGRLAAAACRSGSLVAEVGDDVLGRRRRGPASGARRAGSRTLATSASSSAERAARRCDARARRPRARGTARPGRDQHPRRAPAPRELAPAPTGTTTVRITVPTLSPRQREPDGPTPRIRRRTRSQRSAYRGLGAELGRPVVVGVGDHVGGVLLLGDAVGLVVAVW